MAYLTPPRKTIGGRATRPSHPQASCYENGADTLRPERRKLGRAVLTCVSLLKLRIVALLLFVSLTAAFLAAHGALAMIPMMSLVVAGSLAAGGSGALNHYLDRDLDSLMERTSQRPLVTGWVTRPGVVLGLGLSLIALSVALALPQNVWQAMFLLAGAVVYVVVYTLWLKRRSPLNVVVGGAAGSCAVLAGWATVGVWWTPQPLLIALLLFFWTPPHFWSLAIIRHDDYRRAGVPMLPVVAGPAVAARWGLAHVLLVLLISLTLAVVGPFGSLYGSAAVVAGALFAATAIWQAWRPDAAAARLHFRASIVYLAALFAAMMLDMYI